MVRSSSDLFAALAQVGQDGVDAVLVDRAQALGGNAQLHPAVLGGNPEAALMEIGQETAAGLVHRVRDVVAGRRTLAGDLADSGHGAPRWVAENSAWVLPLAREASAPPATWNPRGGRRFGKGAADAAAVPGGPESRFRGSPLPALRADGTQRAGHYRQNIPSRQLQARAARATPPAPGFRRLSLPGLRRG